MYNECGNQITVGDIFLKDSDNEYECVATVKNYSNLCKRITIGESISSNDFGMIFPNSIGESKWRFLFYPKGQYVGERGGNFIGIYLQMLSCEQADKTLNAKVAFQLKSENAAGPIKKLSTEFDFTVPSKRWIGEPNFFAKDWLNTKRGKQFSINDSLAIQCIVEETEKVNRLPNNAKKHESDNVENGGRISPGYDSLDDFEDKKDVDWTAVGSKKAVKKGKRKLQAKNEDNVDASKPKNNQQRKKKNNNKRGGEKKK